MARFNTQTADNYGGQGGGHKFFSLANDRDIATVRFMYNGVEDIQGFSVHEVEVDGRKKYVNCPREYNEPIDNCPFCAEHRLQKAVVYIPVYVIDGNGNGEVRVWERGKKFLAKITGICSRYPNVVSHTFEVERHGAKGDTGTTYEIYETGQDDTILEDLPEIPNVLGDIILDKTPEEMDYYLKYGKFPNGTVQNDSRRESVQRRVPSNRREVETRRREAF